VVVDWSGKLEAYHTDGRVVALTYDRDADKDGHWTDVVKSDDDAPGIWSEDGKPMIKGWDGWRIRNVQPATAIPAVERPSDEVVERMVALVRGMAADDIYGVRFSEARAITTLLPKPVDPDLIEAREIAARNVGSLGIVNMILQGGMDEGCSVKCALAGIKYGRGA